uniref:ORF63 n=1 Tax=Nitrosopumilaceae spindle-shaped virus TaxID=3065433 RepID=A0AAT9J7K4_9VIRU
MKRLSFISSHPKTSIILIILAGAISSSAYAASTIITDTGITTTNLTVTGTCSGCGGAGSFNSYALVFNNTIATTNIHFINKFQIGNDKSVLVSDTFVQGYMINSTQQVINSFSNSGAVVENTPQNDQSFGGKYKIAYNDSTKKITVSKNDAVLQTLFINTSQFNDGTNLSNEGVSISSDGKYIGIFGLDTTGIIDRLIIYQGS